MRPMALTLLRSGWTETSLAPGSKRIYLRSRLPVSVRKATCLSAALLDTSTRRGIIRPGGGVGDQGRVPDRIRLVDFVSFADNSVESPPPCPFLVPFDGSGIKLSDSVNV